MFKIAAYLLTEDEKAQIVRDEINFLQKAIEMREKLLNQLSTVAETCGEVKDLVKAIEILSKEIKQSYKLLDTLDKTVSEGATIDIDVDFHEMEEKLKEISNTVV